MYILDEHLLKQKGGGRQAGMKLIRIKCEMKNSLGDAATGNYVHGVGRVKDRARHFDLHKRKEEDPRKEESIHDRGGLRAKSSQAKNTGQ